MMIRGWYWPHLSFSVRQITDRMPHLVFWGMGYEMHLLFESYFWRLLLKNIFLNEFDIRWRMTSWNALKEQSILQSMMSSLLLYLVLLLPWSLMRIVSVESFWEGYIQTSKGCWPSLSLIIMLIWWIVPLLQKGI